MAEDKTFATMFKKKSMITNKLLLTNYVENFYGYGNLNSDYWFVGKEETGGETYQKINSRLINWKNLNG